MPQRPRCKKQDRPVFACFIFAYGAGFGGFCLEFDVAGDVSCPQTGLAAGGLTPQPLIPVIPVRPHAIFRFPAKKIQEGLMREGPRDPWRALQIPYPHAA